IKHVWTSGGTHNINEKRFQFVRNDHDRFGSEKLWTCRSGSVCASFTTPDRCVSCAVNKRKERDRAEIWELLNRKSSKPLSSSEFMRRTPALPKCRLRF